MGSVNWACVFTTPFLQVLLELRGQSDADYDELDEGTQVARIQVRFAMFDPIAMTRIWGRRQVAHPAVPCSFCWRRVCANCTAASSWPGC